MIKAKGRHKKMEHQNISNFKEKYKGLIALLLMALSIFLITLIVSTIVDIQNKVKEGRYIGQEIESKNNITVTDTGEIYAKPDLAVTVFSVVNEAKTVQQAMSENTSKMNAVINAVKSKGVDEKDLKTTSFNIYPRYEYIERSDIYPSGKRVLAGYEIRQSLQVKIREMDKIGTIIESATSAGSNQVGDLQFTIDDQDAIKAQARTAAIEKAKDKAKNIASDLGVKLVRITNFSESSVLPYYARSFEMMDSEMGIGGAVPEIETGENKISVTVSITYEID